ncbi:protein phosphatase regulator GAC1 [Nakaseomyces bracarensis]|uniref:protein phosphatase regulator GAC1 n=1 Tax=Nakaseomyces bracarensis TaxID=273131 RepID=UPI0038720D42
MSILFDKKNGSKLKPSLKSYSSFDDSTSNNKTHNRSLSNTSSLSSFSSMKNVRFATNLTTVKNFDIAAEPISISHENSPTLRPVASVPQPSIRDENVLYLSDYDDFTRHVDLNFLHGFHKSRDISFFLDDDDTGDDDDDENVDDGFIRDHELKQFFGSLYANSSSKKLSNTCGNSDIHNELNANSSRAGHDYRNMSSSLSQIKNIDNSLATSVPNIPNCVSNTGSSRYGTDDLLTEMNWKLVNSNVNSHRKSSNSNEANIHLVSLTQNNHTNDSIVGRIIVKNISFEKFIEAKYTFNNWKDIHYSTALFKKSISSDLDEFEFTINLNTLKYILQFKNILQFHSDTANLNMELCCRYDVNGETYYDNNDYDNYCSTLMVTRVISAPLVNPIHVANDIEKSVVVSGPEKKQPTNTTTKKPLTPSAPRISSVNGSLSSNIFFGKPSSRRRRISSRTFSDNTDYYNTSPLKHLYHSDPTSWVKPKRLNEVLYDSNTPSSSETDGNAVRNDSISHIMQEPLTEREHLFSELDYTNLNDSMDTLTSINLMNHSINSYETLNNSKNVAKTTPNASIEQTIPKLNLQDETLIINEISNDSVIELEFSQSPMNPVMGELESNEDKQSVVTDTTLDIEALKRANVSPPPLPPVVPVLNYYDCYSTANNSVETITQPLSETPASYLKNTDELPINRNLNSFEESLSKMYNIPLTTDNSHSTINNPISKDPGLPIVVDTDNSEANDDTKSSISSGSGTIIASDHIMGTRDSVILPTESNGTDYQKFLTSSYFGRPSSSSSSVSTTDSSMSTNSIVTSNSGSLASVLSSIPSSDTGSFIYEYNNSFNNNVYRIPSKNHAPNFSDYVFNNRKNLSMMKENKSSNHGAVTVTESLELADPIETIMPPIKPTLKVSDIQ